MPSPCAFQGCRMTKEISRVIGLNISFFQIPRNESLRKQWLSRCKPKVNLKHSLVCSLHFEEKDFERDLRAELLNLKPKLILKKTSVPTKKGETDNQEINDIIINEHNYNTDNLIKCTSNFQTDVDKQKTDKQINDTSLLIKEIEIIDHHQEIEGDTNTETSSNKILEFDYQKLIEDNIEIPPASIEIEIIDYQEEKNNETSSNELEKRVSDLQIEVSQLRLENYELKKKLARKQKIVSRQRRQNNTLSQVIRNFRSKQNRDAKKVVDQIIRDKLMGVFTSKQLDKILTKKQVRWSDEDISIACTLRLLSKPCYLYLRNRLNYPLPGETTIHSWYSKTNTN